MKEKRSGASSIVYDNKLWITGGKKFQVHTYMAYAFFGFWKKVALSKYAVVKLKSGFLMKSFIMNAPLSSFGFAVAPTKKWWWRCSTHKDAFIINYPLFSSAKKPFENLFLICVGCIKLHLWWQWSSFWLRLWWHTW